MTQARVPYGGVATRAVALAVDAAIAQGIVFAGGAMLALVGSLVVEVQLGPVAKVLAGCAWALVVGGYFVLFWSTVGQTPGMRLMGVHVVGPDGAPPGVLRSLVRLVGLALAILLLFLGFVPALLDDRRRALQDFLARTVVLYDVIEEPGRVSEAAGTSIVRDPLVLRGANGDAPVPHGTVMRDL
jgi:uncharacterized RDD family membrane protein YckC